MLMIFCTSNKQQQEHKRGGGEIWTSLPKLPSKDRRRGEMSRKKVIEWWKSLLELFSKTNKDIQPLSNCLMS